MTSTVATTASGQVRGLVRGGVHVFKGVPYAAAPVGERRFRSPEPPVRWAGVRDATEPGPTAPFNLRPFETLDVRPLIGEGWRKGDDYLNVNIWTPDPAADGLPVMVFIHGGAFVAGCNESAAADGAAFARSGVVCCAINYRMGIDGFLPIEGVPTNLGLRDQIAALQWVRDNIAGFGGDPEKVTVFGESAGAMSIANLIASPLAKGLFRRAIIQSGHGEMVRSIPVAKRLTRRLARMLKVKDSREGFGRVSFEEGLAAVDKVQAPMPGIDLREPDGREPAYGLSRFLPVWGDDVLPRHPLQALAQGLGAEVEVLIGTNREEMNIYLVPTGVKAKISGLLAWLFLRNSEPHAGRVLKAYGLGAKGRRAGEALADATHDLVFRLPARRFAAAHRGRTHFYEFGWRSPAFDGELGACHALEIPFVFDTLASCSGPNGFVGESPPQALADRIHGLWVAFARSGAAPWPAYEVETRQVYKLEKGWAETDEDMPAARFEA